jgi:hypothetical protein
MQYLLGDLVREIHGTYIYIYIHWRSFLREVSRDYNVAAQQREE